MSDGPTARPILTIGAAEQLREARRIIRQEASTLDRLAESLGESFVTRRA